MSAYREPSVAEGHVKTTVPLEPIPMPQGITTTGLGLAALGVVAMLRHPHDTIPRVFAVVGLVMVFLCWVLESKRTLLVLDREADAVEIHSKSRVQRLRLSRLEEVVTERTPLVVRIFLRTTAGEEILLWHGLSSFAGDVPARVRAAVAESLEDAKTPRE